MHGVSHFQNLLSPQETEQVLHELECLFRNPAPRDTFAFMGKDILIPRDAMKFYMNSPDGRIPLYRYTRSIRCKNPDRIPFDNVTLPAPMSPSLTHWINTYHDKAGMPRPNHIVAHRYCGGRDHIGPHHDKVADMQRPELRSDVFIGVFSVGATRTFRILEKKESTFQKAQDYTLNHGDAVFMNYDANLKYKHEVVPEHHPCGVRYSITSRTMATWYDSSNGTAITANGTTHLCPTEIQ